MTVGILTEKPSAARNFAKALGGMAGNHAGVNYVIASARGHLYEFKDPADLVPADLSTQYKSWDLEHLPWDPQQFSWEREPRESVTDVIKSVRQTLSACDEIVIATDVDPTGEGELIAWEVIDELGFHGRKVTRMFFLDESAASLRKAFTSRVVLPSMQADPDFRKADLRSKFDLLTMQFTRVATKCAGQKGVLRQGRLKSAMVWLVGQGLDAYNNWEKVPFFQNRFRDENGVMYTDPDEAKYDTKMEVPFNYHASPVVLDKRENKRQSPPRLLDLAALSSLLSAKGVRAKQVLETYQKMYEAQVVSYPRTEDKTITPEQFNELLPKVDQIAAVVGVDVSLLTHRAPRPTHVKAAGAHGANRPGPNVPASMAAIKTSYGQIGEMIYLLLARNYLAMLCEDYLYERQSGHVRDYPTFVGAANVPQSAGYKAIFGEVDDDDEDENLKGLGTNADPFIHEGFPPRPPHPTMKWLMKQLEKRDVGTGATRTSIYADVTSTASKYPLLVETKGKLTLGDFGKMSYLLLPGTHIGDLSMTEYLQAEMRAVAAGTKTADQVLDVVAGWVVEDIATMQANVVGMREVVGIPERKERYSGVWKGQQIMFAREWGGHRFTDTECAALCRGEEITVRDLTSSKGNAYSVKGRLANLEHKGHKYVGFERTGFGDDMPSAICGHQFTPDERKRLLNGEKIYVDGMRSSGGNIFAATLSWGTKPGETKKSLIFDFGD